MNSSGVTFVTLPFVMRILAIALSTLPLEVFQYGERRGDPSSLCFRSK